MTEREYIDITNLAKAQMAKLVVKELDSDDPQDYADRRTAFAALCRIEARYSVRVCP